MDYCAAGVRAHGHQAVACALGSRSHETVDANKADAHRVDERVLRVALVEVPLAADWGDTDAVPIAADARDDSIEMMTRGRQRAEAQGVEQGDGPGAHGDHVADDAAHAGRGALVWLYGGGGVVRLDLERGRPALADPHRAGRRARPFPHRRSAR